MFLRLLQANINVTSSTNSIPFFRNSFVKIHINAFSKSTLSFFSAGLGYAVHAAADFDVDKTVTYKFL